MKGIVQGGKIEGGTDTSDATATISDIATSKTAYISTGKVTGTLFNLGEGIVKIISAVTIPTVSVVAEIV